MNNFDLIKERVPIVEHVRKYDELPYESSRFSQGAHTSSDHGSKNGRCLTVYHDGSYECYNCGESGSVIDYEAHRRGVDVKAAVSFLAAEYGIELNSVAPLSEEERRVRDERVERDKSVQALLNESAKFWQSAMGDAQYAYWAARGITAESVDAYGIGYAGGDRRALVRYLYKEYGCDDYDLLRSTGLFYEGESGDKLELRCLFERRHMLPTYRDIDGNVMHFIGRDATGVDEKKYVNQRSKAADGVNERVVQHGLWGLERVRRPGNILITEGIVDGIAAQQALPEWRVISGGSTQWSEAKVDMLVEKLAVLRGTKVQKDVRCNIVVCYDKERGVPSESPGNTAAVSLCDDVEKQLALHYESKVERVPKSEKAAVKEAKQSAEESIEARKPTMRIARLPLPEGQDKMDVAEFLLWESPKRLSDWLGRALTPYAFRAWLANKPSRFVNPFDKSSTEKFVPIAVSDELRLAHYHAEMGEELYRYAGGVYVKAKKAVEQEVCSLLGTLSTGPRVKEVVNGIRRQEAHTEAASPYGQKDRLINVRNGVISIPDTGDPVLLEHTPYHRSTMQFNARWDESASPSAFDKFLSEVVNADCVELVYEMIGYCLVETAAVHKSFILEGSGSNGKSTLIKVIEVLLGAENYCAKTLSKLERDKFSPAELYGKAANLYADMSIKRMENSEMFKMIASGDTLTGERKYRDAFTFQPTATQIVSVNELPPSDDRSHGFYRRLCIIPFPNTFSGAAEKAQDKLLDELTTPAELDGILLRAVYAVQGVFQRGNKLTHAASVAEKLLEYQRDNNNALAFIESQMTIPDKGNNESKAEVYTRYVSYCEDELKESSMSAKEFHKEFRRAHPSVEVGKRKIGSSRRDAYLDVSLVDDGSEDDGTMNF